MEKTFVPNSWLAAASLHTIHKHVATSFERIAHDLVQLGQQGEAAKSQGEMDPLIRCLLQHLAKQFLMLLNATSQEFLAQLKRNTSVSQEPEPEETDRGQ